MAARCFDRQKGKKVNLKLNFGYFLTSPQEIVAGSENKISEVDLEGKSIPSIPNDVMLDGTPVATDELGRSVYCTYQLNMISVILRSASGVILATHKIPVSNSATCGMISIAPGGPITIKESVTGDIGGKTAGVPNDNWILRLDSNLLPY